MATRHLQKHFWLILCLPPCSHFPTMAHNTPTHHTPHNTTTAPQTTDRDLESFVNAWICAQRATDRDLESFCECSDIHLSGNRPWSWKCLQRECLDMCLSNNRPWSWDEKVNAWICAPNSTQHIFIKNCNNCNACNACNFVADLLFSI